MKINLVGMIVPLTIEDVKLGENPNVLSGEKTERKKTDDGEEIMITRWNLTKGRK